jgi:dCMP deaminase
MDWDEYFIKMCKLVASKSKDKSIKVGCVIVGPDHEIRSTGYNGFVRGADDENPDWYKRPLKYKVTAHAELNAVTNAARVGTPLLGCIAYTTLHPCSNCALVLAQAGIKIIKTSKIDSKWKNRDAWKEEFKISKQILEAAKVDLIFI